MGQTVKIVNKQKKGSSPFLTINAEDFDPEKHTAYDDSKQEKAAAKKAESDAKPWNDAMTKERLLEVGKQFEVELNPRSNKEEIVAELDKAWAAEQSK